MKTDLTRNAGVFIAVAALVLRVVLGGQASAVDTHKVTNADGFSVFSVDFYNKTDELSPDGRTSTWDLSSDEKEAVIRGIQYWVDRILPRGEVNQNPIQLYITTKDKDGKWVFTGAEASKVYGDGFARRYVPMDSASYQPNSHFGITGSQMSLLMFRNYQGFTEVELAALNDIGYQIDLRNFYGRSVYTDGNTIDNTQGYFARNSGGTDYIVGEENLASYGMGLHVYGSNNKLTQKADLLAKGVGGGGIRVDGVENTIVIDDGVTVSANGKLGTGVLFAYGRDHVLVNKGTITATGTDGDAVRFDLGTNHGAADFISYIPIGFFATPSEEWKGHVAALNGAMVDAFDVTGTIEGDRSAIYIGRGTHVKEINVMDGAEITGDIISDYDYNPGNYVKPKATSLTFGKVADADGRATDGADSNFDFTITGKILGDKKAAGSTDYYSGRGMINMDLYGGTTTAASTSDINVYNLTMKSGSTFMMEADVNVAEDFSITGATLGYSTAEQGVLKIGGSGVFSGTNTLDFSDFNTGTYTIVEATGSGTLNQIGTNAFSNVTFQGQSLAARHSVNLATSTDKKVIAALIKNIGTIYWNQGGTVWDTVTQNWTYKGGAAEVKDTFIDGDHVVFDATTGSIAVASEVNYAGKMDLNNGANHTFTGEKVNVAAGMMDGTLNIVGGSSASFEQGFSAHSLTVDSSTLSWGAPSSAGSFALNGGTLDYRDGSGLLAVNGTVTFTGSNTLNLLTNRPTAQYIILNTASLSDGAAASFGKLLLNGNSLTSRQEITLDDSMDKLTATLIADKKLNIQWRGGDGNWHTSYWNDRGAVDETTTFMDGDNVTFKGGTGTVTLNSTATAKVTDMTMDGGAKYVFTGGHVNVDKAVPSTLPTQTGTLEIKDGSSATFNNGFTADALNVTEGSNIGIKADSTVNGDVTIKDSSLSYYGEALAIIDGNVTLTGTNTLILDDFTDGDTYTIITVTGGTFTGGQSFGSVKVGDKNLTGRQTAQFDSTSSDSVKVTLTEINTTVNWSQADGSTWDLNKKNYSWLDNTKTKEYFKNGDHAIFTDTNGVVEVGAAGVIASTLDLKGAKHTFTGGKVTVDGTSISVASLPQDGKLSLTGGSQANFVAGFAADQLSVSGNSALTIGTVSKVKDGAEFASGAIFGVSLAEIPSSDDARLTAGTVSLGGNNTLDLDEFSNGQFAILTGTTSVTNLNAVGFDTVTVAGNELTVRQKNGISWTSSTGNEIILSLDSANQAMNWTAENGGTWDSTSGTAANWADPAGKSDSFIGGDNVFFDGTSGSVNVASAVKPSDMKLNNATHTFLGSQISVAKGNTTTLSGATGTLLLSNSSKGVFSAGFAADHLVVDNSTLEVGATSSVTGNVTFTDATYVYSLGNTPSLTVTGSTTLSGGNNTLELDRLEAGAYTIITGGAFTANSFDKVTNGGEELGSRYTFDWGTNVNTIELNLSFQNLSLTWHGGNGVWDGTARNWDYATASENFAVGDVAVFDKGAGAITVNTNMKPADMIFTNNAAYSFTGEDLTVTNNSTATGSVKIDGGATASFENALTADALDVSGKGTFAVTGKTATITGDAVVNGGAIHARSIGSTPAVQVKGDAGFTNATLDILTDNATSSLIHVDGTADIAGGTVNFSGVQRHGMKYTFLTAGTLNIINEFGLGLLANGTGILAYDSNNYWLQMDGNLVSYEELGSRGSGNLRALGGYLDRVSESLNPTDDLNLLLFQMDDMTEPAALDTLSRLLGNVYGTTSTSSFQQSTAINNTLSTALRGGMAERAVAEDECYDPCGVASFGDSGRGNVWGTALGYYGNTGGEVGYTRNIHGGIVGVDFLLKSTVRAGVFGSFGSGRTKLDLENEKLTSDEYMFGVYFARDWRKGYLMASGGVGYNDYAVTRRIDAFSPSRSTKSDFGAVTTMAYLESGLKLTPRFGRIQPYVGVQYSGHHQKTVNEKGADSIDLSLERESSYSVRAQIGVRGEFDLMRCEDSALTLNTEGAWLRELRNQAPGSYTVRMAGSGNPVDSFRLEGVDPRRNWGMVKAGLAYEKKNLRVYGEYNAYLNGRQRIHGWQAGASVSF